MGRVKIDVVKVQNDSNFLFVRSLVCLFVFLLVKNLLDLYRRYCLIHELPLNHQRDNIK